MRYTDILEQHIADAKRSAMRPAVEATRRRPSQQDGNRGIGSRVPWRRV